MEKQQLLMTACQALFLELDESIVNDIINKVAEALDEAKSPCIVLSNFMQEHYPFDVRNPHDYDNVVEVATRLLTPVEIQDVFKELFKQIEFCNFECEGGMLIQNSAYIELKNLLASHPVLGLSKSQQRQQTEIKKVHDEQVYGRLMKICLDSYQNSKTDFDFDLWMERKGLVKSGGFFVPIENYDPTSY